MNTSMPLDAPALRQALSALPGPDGSCFDPAGAASHWSQAKTLKDLQCQAGVLRLTLHWPYPVAALLPDWEPAVREWARAQAGVDRVEFDHQLRIEAHAAQRGVALLPGVKNIVAVASGKGGVGKSTTCANLALALAAQGARVGILDADIYGPSQTLMLGVSHVRPDSVDGKTMQPLRAHGLQLMSMGALVDADNPMIWRGPMASQTLEQLLRQTQWTDLDYLLLDMPPGTGDIQLTTSQRIPVTGAVIVTTPQDLALIDARRAARMFEKVGVPVLGVIENMAMHVCSQCGHVEHIFGQGGAARMCSDFHLDFLGALPLALRIREQADAGCPTVVAEPDCEESGLYRQAALQLAARVARLGKDYSAKMPPVAVEGRA